VRSFLPERPVVDVGPDGEPPRRRAAGFRVLPAAAELGKTMIPLVTWSVPSFASPAAVGGSTLAGTVAADASSATNVTSVARLTVERP